MIAVYLARLTATFKRFLLNRNDTPRGASSADDAAIDTNTTGACLPWNLSTVPTSTSARPAASSRRRRVTTWALYGVTMRTCCCAKRVVPCSSVHGVPSSRVELRDDGVRLLGTVGRVAVVVDRQHPHAGRRRLRGTGRR